MLQRVISEKKASSKRDLGNENRPTIVFLTVCTQARTPWLADDAIHEALRSTWRSATNWKVGKYVLMPDHLHLFAWPGIWQADFDGWVRYWKSQFLNNIDNPALRWQSNCFHHWLRSCESAEAKHLYMTNNPVRAHLIARSEEWPFKGEIFKSESWW
jgi:putative transposase